MRSISPVQARRDRTTATMSRPALNALHQLQAFLTQKYGRYITASEAIIEAVRMIREADQS